MVFLLFLIEVLAKKGKAPAQRPGLSCCKALEPEIGHTYGAMSRHQ